MFEIGRLGTLSDQVTQLEANQTGPHCQHDGGGAGKSRPSAIGGHGDGLMAQIDR